MIVNRFEYLFFEFFFCILVLIWHNSGIVRSLAFPLQICPTILKTIKRTLTLVEKVEFDLLPLSTLSLCFNDSKITVFLIFLSYFVEQNISTSFSEIFYFFKKKLRKFFFTRINIFLVLCIHYVNSHTRYKLLHFFFFCFPKIFISVICCFCFFFV